MKTVSILGSTGSVGRSTVDLLQHHKEEYRVNVLTAMSNAGLLAEQADALNARKVVIGDVSLFNELSSLLAHTDIEVDAGRAAIIRSAAEPADWIMAAIVGMAGLEPILAAIGQGTCVAIANKEPLVAAGPMVIEAARKSGATLLPVDSEHNAVFQVFEKDNVSAIERIVLTASGGPFRTWSKEQMDAATPEQAVAHPNWSMGAKISVDSATMMNKALEVIEASYLFDMPPEKIDVLVHPQSVIHSMVEYADGSFLAQLGAPDMRTPITNALGWPKRIATSGQKLDLATLKRLDFEALDTKKFPAVDMARACLKAGPASCIVFNAANEIAVQAFLDREIGFSAIIEVVQALLDKTTQPDVSGLAEIIAFDQSVRDDTTDYINHRLSSGRGRVGS
ncbi:MAG: 1-deoxy-D-xylulose 5-phosphate reductoisomerase [Micavibrio sp.]|nr:1-deoxy-D-xylulose 5-phosphate reductoisomerase [Micavibrio sp.]